MKLAFYYDNDHKQMVITPENDTERRILDELFPDERISVGLPAGMLEYRRGGFYHCQGGWIRESGSKEDGLIVTVPK